MKRYIRKNCSAFAWAAVCVLIGTVFATILQFFKGDVLDYAVAGNTYEAIRYALLLIGFILLEVLFYYLFSRLSARFHVSCVRGLKADLFCGILGRSFTQFKSMQHGEYIAKYANDAQLIGEMHFSMLPMLVQILGKVLMVAAALFWLDWRIALVTIFLLTMPLYVPKLIEKRLQRAQKDYIAAVEKNLAMVTDILSGFEIVKNFSIERSVMSRFAETNCYTAARDLHRKQLGNLGNLITTLMSYLSYFIVLAFAAFLVLRGDFSAGDFFVAVGMIDQLSYPIISLSGIIRQLVSIRPACHDMEDFIASSKGCALGSHCGKLNDGIRFDKACFSYDGEEPLIRDFGLVIKKGGRYLIKGPSGCGKTTAVNLLLRYHDLQSGRITIDGEPIGSFCDTYPLITVVRQEPVLFRDTLRNNLTMYQEIPDARLIGLLNSLGLSKYANADALDAMVAEGGANLSGGEKKRLCLARALMRDTEVLILDEPLANLDGDTAGSIESLLLGISDRTLVVVSHQFSGERIGAFDGVIDMESAA